MSSSVKQLGNMVLSGFSPLWAIVNGLVRPRFSKASWKAPCPVLSVGNILAGGVGKTEIVVLMARYYLAQNKRVTIALRGVGGEQSREGCIAQSYKEGVEKKLSDEALVHLIKNPGVSVAVGAQRGSVLKKFWQELKPDVVILDDGFQHFALARDKDFLVHNFSIQWPVFRDFPGFFEKVNLCIHLTGTESQNKIPRKWQHLPWVRAYYHPTGIKAGINETVGNLPAVCLAFCGIGNPERFKTMLEKAQVQVKAFSTFRDHQKYTRDDVLSLNHWVKEFGHEKIKVLTTLKDFVKLQEFKADLDFSLSYVETDIRFLENESLFFEKLSLS